VVEREKDRIALLLSEQRIFEAAQKRMRMSRDDVMRTTPSLQGSIQQGVDSVQLRQLYAQTEFGRRPDAWKRLGEILSAFPKQATPVIADLTPGYVQLPGNLIATYEPFLLKSLSPNAKILVYDHSPEPLEALRRFHGVLPVYAHWELPTAEDTWQKWAGPPIPSRR
jgi:hypothetical protein